MDSNAIDEKRRPDATDSGRTHRYRTMKRIAVGPGEVAASNNPNHILRALNLGSALAVTAYDPATGACALLHALLPDSTLSPARAATQPALFVDTGVGALFSALHALGAHRQRLQICAIGGASMLHTERVINVGGRNHDRLVAVLAAHQIELHASRVGGWMSLHVDFHVASGRVSTYTGGENNPVDLSDIKPL